MLWLTCFSQYLLLFRNGTCREFLTQPIFKFSEKFVGNFENKKVLVISVYAVRIIKKIHKIDFKMHVFSDCDSIVTNCLVLLPPKKWPRPGHWPQVLVVLVKVAAVRKLAWSAKRDWESV